MTYKRWLEIECGECRGYGVVSVYSSEDFLGPGECKSCGGAGRLFVTPTDRLVLYPGGPLAGHWPGRYVEALAQRGEGDA